VEGEQVHVAVAGEGAQHVEVARRKAGEAEQGEPFGQVDQRRILGQGRAALDQALGRAGGADRLAQVAPQVGLPGHVVGELPAVTVLVAPVEPGQHHRRPVDGVAVEQVGQVADGGEPPVAVGGLGIGAPEVGREDLHLGGADAGVDHLEERPRQPLRPPGVGVAPDPGGAGQGIADQVAGEREPQVGADAVTPPR
jgi:hypothetical protein